MSRNALAVGAIVLVGAVLWVAIAWPAPGDDSALESLEAETDAPEMAAPPQPAAAPPAAADPAEPPTAAAEVPVPEPAEPAEPAPAAEPDPAHDMFAVEQGPVAEYKRRFESEPRDSAANEVESKIRAAFAHPGDGAPDMFRSVLCRQSICKLELNFSQERLGAYVAGITRATATLDTNVAVAPAGPLGADSVRPIEVYIKREPQQQPPEQPPAQQQEQPPAAPEQPAEQQPSAAPEQPAD